MSSGSCACSKRDARSSAWCAAAPQGEPPTPSAGSLPASRRHGLARRFWYLHYKQSAELPEIARLHAAIAQAIAISDVDAAGKALDALLDNIEGYTRSTVV